MTRTRAAVAAFVAAAIALAPAGAARAEMPADGAARNDAAVAAFDTLAGPARARGVMPRLSQTAERPILENLWNAPAILGKPPYAAADLPPLLRIMSKHRDLLTAYLQFSPTPGMTADLNRNAAAYQDEVVHEAAFVLDITAAALTAMTSFWQALPEADRTPVRRQGIRQAQQGFTKIAIDFTMLVQSKAIRPDNRGVLTAALERSGPTLAANLRVEDRAAIATNVRSALPALQADDQAHMRVFLTALADITCTRLCAVQ